MANRISVVIDVVTDKATRGIQNFKTAVRDADGAVGKFKAGSAAAFASLKANAVPAGAVAGAALIKVGTDAVNAASSLEQSVGAVEKSFGDASDEVLAFAEDASNAVGLSKRAYNEAAVSLGSFAKQIAEDTGRPVAEVLNDLITRSADLAATFGTDVTTAIEKVSSGLAGESEPLRRWGIDLRKTQVEAFAAAEGLDEMSDATKGMGLLFEESADYAGQFADEADTLAGQQERLQANIEDIQAAIGEALIPAVTSATEALNDFTDVADALPLNKLGSAGTFFAENFGPTGFWNNIGRVGGAVTGFFKDTEAATWDLTKGVRDLGEAFADDVTSGTYTAEDAYHELERALTDPAGKNAIRDLGDVTSDFEDDIRSAKSMFEQLQTTLDNDQAIADLEQGFEDVESAAFDAFTKAEAGAEDAESAARDYEQSIRDQKQAVLDYVKNGLGRIPPEKLTEIMAALDEGDVARARYILGELTKTRTATINIRENLIRAQGGRQFNFERHAGGPVMPGQAYLVGERGPEILQMGSGGTGNVVNNAGTRKALADGGGSAPVYNIYVTADGLSNSVNIGNVIIDKIKEFERHNGTRWRQ